MTHKLSEFKLMQPCVEINTYVSRLIKTFSWFLHLNPRVRIDTRECKHETMKKTFNTQKLKDIIIIK